jgi:hypothetical protein
VFVPTQNPRQNPRRSPYVQRYQTKAEHGASTEHASPPLVPLARKVPAKFCRIILHFHRASAPLAFHSLPNILPRKTYKSTTERMFSSRTYCDSHIPFFTPSDTNTPSIFVGLEPLLIELWQFSRPSRKRSHKNSGSPLDLRARRPADGLQFDPTPSMSVYPRRPRRRTW